MEKTVYLLGCSFTQALNRFVNVESGDKDKKITFFGDFYKKYNVTNLAYLSRSNFQILEDIKNLPENCIALIQWSALTRPNGIPDYDKDWNFHLNELAYSNEDPLKFLIQNFIKIVTEANQILNEKNIKSFQYLGWVQWTDSEITDEISVQLESLPITWFSTPTLVDVIKNNCWEYNPPSLTNSIKTLLGGNPDKWEWKSFKWGGMSEWIRLNIKDPYKRYVAIHSKDGYNDPHPSMYATQEFYETVIFPQLNKLIGDI